MPTDSTAQSPPPAVSVVMAVYNGLPFLTNAIDSILTQTFADFELILVNDGSTDATGAVIDEAARRDQRVRTLHQPNLGLIASLNRGVELARAPLLARMDSDDLSMPDRIARQVAFMHDHPEVVLLGGSYLLIDEHGLPIRTMRPALDNATLQEQCLAGTQPICHPLAMMRTHAIRAVNAYDPRYKAAEDLDLFLKLGEVGQLACIPDVLLHYRQHANSVSERSQDLQLANQRAACEAAYRRRGLTRTFTPVKPWRPTTADQRFRFTLDYGWWALQEGFRPSARAYATKALRSKPWSKEAWTLLWKTVSRKSG